MTDTAPKPDRVETGYSQEDWDEVSDTPELTESEAADLRPARAVPCFRSGDVGVRSVRTRR